MLLTRGQSCGAGAASFWPSWSRSRDIATAPASNQALKKTFVTKKFSGSDNFLIQKMFQHQELIFFVYLKNTVFHEYLTYVFEQI